jgi:mannose/fructose/N-acetylgalactosamine-specific phosphotransferase system component IIC
MISAPRFIANTLYVLCVLALAVYWLTTLDTFGMSMGAAGIVIAWGLWQRQRWGYFAAGAWFFGLMRLAMDKYSGVYSEQVESVIRGVGFLGVVMAVVLHELAAKRKPEESPEQAGDSEPKDSSL